MVINKGRTKRLALLSEKERQLIDDYDKRKELGPKDRAKISRGRITLLKELDERLDALIPDLEYIVYDKALRPLLLQKLDGLEISLGLLTKELEIIKPLTVEDKSIYIQGYHIWRIKTTDKDRRTCYWLSTNESPEITQMDYTKPEYAMRGIKGKWVNNNKVVDVRKIIKKALELELMKSKSVRDTFPSGLIPHSEENAITIYEIKERVSNFEKKSS